MQGVWPSIRDAIARWDADKPEPKKAGQPTVLPYLTPREVSLVHTFQAVKAIAAVRERLNISLTDAKAIVDDYRNKAGIPYQNRKNRK